MPTRWRNALDFISLLMGLVVAILWLRSHYGLCDEIQIHQNEPVVVCSWGNRVVAGKIWSDVPIATGTRLKLGLLPNESAANYYLFGGAVHRLELSAISSWAGGFSFQYDMQGMNGLCAPTVMISVPNWFLVTIFLALPLLSSRRRMVFRRRIRDRICVACGYDLRASGRVCSECGRPIDSIPSTHSSVLSTPSVLKPTLHERSG